jgi:hypothetical protein
MRGVQPDGERDLAGYRARPGFHAAPGPGGAAALSQDEDTHTLDRFPRRVRLRKNDLRSPERPKPAGCGLQVEQGPHIYMILEGAQTLHSDRKKVVRGPSFTVSDG